jgi:hypothetical protein
MEKDRREGKNRGQWGVDKSGKQHKDGKWSYGMKMDRRKKKNLHGWGRGFSKEWTKMVRLRRN